MRNILHGLPLPRPWRLIFQELPALLTQSPQYAQLAALAEGGPKALLASQFGRWDVDQDKGRFIADLKDGRSLTADVHFIGTHDGHDFLWADRNPSFFDTLCGAAQALRQNLPPELASLATTDKIGITPRDVLVLTGLTAKAFDCDLVLMAPSHGTFIAMALTDVQVSMEKDAPKNGFFTRLFRKKPTPSVADQLASLRNSVDTALNRWQQHLLPVAALRALEPDLDRAYDAIQNADTATALEILTDIQTRMGPHPQDQEPTAWVYFCEGLVAAAAGNLPRAREAFATSARGISPVSSLPLMLAQARVAEPETHPFYLNAAYLFDPDGFANLANAQELDAIKTALQSTSSARKSETPSEVLHAVIAALCDIEIIAAARHAAAKETRDHARITSEADALARMATNRDYAELLLTWATPNRRATLGSYSSKPSNSPDLIDAVVPMPQTQTKAAFIVTFNGPVPNTTSSYRYDLTRITMPLTQTSEWRLERITGGPAEASYRLF